MGIIEIWSIVAVVLHFADVGAFANWAIIDWPWHWSCLCLELWILIVYVGLIAACCIVALPYKSSKK